MAAGSSPDVHLFPDCGGHERALIRSSSFDGEHLPLPRLDEAFGGVQRCARRGAARRIDAGGYGDGEMP